MSTGKLNMSLLRLAALLCVVVAAGAVAGGALAKAPPGDCGWTPATQPLLPLGDSDYYFLLSGSSFEGDTTGWSFDGGAGVVSGNESFYANGASDSQSLALPTGAAATTPDVCVTVQSPTLRLFVLNTGAKDAKLTVSLNFTDKDGKARTQKLKDIGTDKTNGSWTLTDPLKFLGPINSILDHDGKANVSFTFAPKDNKGSWQIDELYVDPMKSQ
jgi:hypothetical protein